MKFYDSSIYVLAQNCVEEVRKVAAECPVISQRMGGVIRIDFCPEPGEKGGYFRKWLGIPEGTVDCDSLQLVYRIFPHWDFRIQDDGIVDCAAYAEMKIASAAARAEKGSGATSGKCAEIIEIPEGSSAEEYGYSEYRGAYKLLVEVLDTIIGDIFVAVSGGSEEEDERMLGAAMQVILGYFRDDRSVNIIL